MLSFCSVYLLISTCLRFPQSRVQFDCFKKSINSMCSLIWIVGCTTMALLWTRTNWVRALELGRNNPQRMNRIWNPVFRRLTLKQCAHTNNIEAYNRTARVRRLVCALVVPHEIFFKIQVFSRRDPLVNPHIFYQVHWHLIRNFNVFWASLLCRWCFQLIYIEV